MTIPELATAWVTLTANTRGMETEIKRALNRVDGGAEGRRVGQKFSQEAAQGANFTGIERKAAESGRRSASAFGTAFKTFAGAAVGAIGAGGIAGIFSVLDRGFDRLKTIDSARFKLQALGNDAGTVKTIMDSALKSVQGTAFSMGDAASAAASAVAAGVKPGADLTKYLSGISDSAAVAGTSFNDMAAIFNKVHANNVAYTDDLQQLQDRGLPVMQLLADKYGVSAEALRKMVQDGKVSAADFEDVLNTKIGGAAQKMGQSFEGSMQNLTAATARVGANFLSAIFGGDPNNQLAGPTEAVQALTDKFDQVNAWITTNGPQIHAFFADMSADVKAVAGVLGDVAGLLFDHPHLVQLAAEAYLAFKSAQVLGSIATLTNAIGTGSGAGATGLVGGVFTLAAALGVDLGFTIFDKMKQGARDAQAAIDETNRKLHEQFPGVPVTPAGVPAQTGSTAPNNPLNPNNIYGPPRPGRATGGAIFGAGTATSDSIPALLSNGEHVLTAKDVAAMGGQGGVYALRQALHRAGGGGIAPWMLAQVPWPPDKVRKTRDAAGNVPNLDPGSNPAQGALPSWWDPEAPIPNGIPGLPKPPTRDDILFPDWMPPGQRDEWMRRWGDNARKIKPLGFAGGGAVLPDQPGNYVVTPPNNIMSAVQFAQSVSGSPYNYGSAGPKLFDCSGFMSAIYGVVTGKPQPVGQRFFTTESDFSKLGFLPGFDPNSPFNIGVHNGGGGMSSHMAGTLAGYNVESGGGHGTLIGEGAAGANDPQFENKYHLPGSLSALTQSGASTGSELTQAYSDSLSQGGQDAAKEVATKPSGGGMDGSSLGQSLVSGLLQGIGLDGSVFSNPLDWPNVKSGLALANWGGGLLKSAMGGGDPASTDLTGGVAGGSLSGIGLPSIAGLLKTTPLPDAVHQGTGAPPGPAVVVNGNIGMDPRQFTQRVDAAQNQSWRRNMTAVRP